LQVKEEKQPTKREQLILGQAMKLEQLDKKVDAPDNVYDNNLADNLKYIPVARQRVFELIGYNRDTIV